MPAWRFRRCPRCGYVGGGGSFEVLRVGTGHWHARGGSRRRCPECWHVDFTQGFPIVDRPESERTAARVGNDTGDGWGPPA